MFTVDEPVCVIYYLLYMHTIFMRIVYSVSVNHFLLLNKHQDVCTRLLLSGVLPLKFKINWSRAI